MKTRRKVFSSVLFVLLAVWLTSPCFPGQDALSVDLRVPSPLYVGQAYEAELRVRSPSAVPDAYAKISLPQAFKVISRQAHYRGSLDAASDFVLRLKFQVLSIPTGTIAGKVFAYYGESRSVIGKGQILYCRPVDGALVLSDKSPDAEEDSLLEAQMRSAPATERERASLIEQRLRRSEERAVVREDSTGPKYGSGLVSSELLPENASITTVLEPGQPKVYGFNGHRGDRIWVTARSEQLDPRLLLLRSDGTVVAEDDDGAGMLNARIPAQGVFELSSDDTYFVVVYDHGGSPGNIRLEIQNFTHLQPPPGAVLPAKTPPTPWTGAVAAETTVIGKIVYNFPTGGTAPVRLALVKLFVDIPFARDVQLSSSQTDVNGEVSFRVPQANLRDTLYVQVFSQDAGFDITSVEDPLLGLHSAESSHFTLPAATTVTFGTWNVAGAGQNGPFLVFDAAVEGYLIAKDVLNFTARAIKVNFPVRNWLGLFTKPYDDDACFNCPGHEGEIDIGELYQDSPDVVLHEYGHFLAALAGFSQLVGGHHTLGRRTEYPSLAWGEGWATFFAVAGQNAHGKKGKTRYVSYHPKNLQDYSLENGHDPNGVLWEAEAGDDNETSVAFVLWDLFDDLQDYLPVARSVDTVALGLKPIFDVAKGGAVLAVGDSLARYRIAYLVTFYDGLFQQLSFRWDQVRSVQAVLQDQRIGWEGPPAAPVGLRFRMSGSTVQLEWQAGSSNTAGFIVEQKLPGQATFTPVAAPLVAVYSLPNLTVGTTFRVTAVSFNVARGFTAPLQSAPSQEITYTAPPPPANPVIALSRSELSFTFNIGDAVPAAQTISVSNAGGGSLTWVASSNVAWLSVLPTSGTAPSTISVAVNPANLAVGTYSGTITISSAGIASQTITVTLKVSVPVPSITGVVNAASFQPGMVPGGLATLFGKSLSPISGIEFPGGATSYKGVSVTVEGHQVPLLAVSNVGGQEQINFQVPFDLGTPAMARVEVNNNGSVATVSNVPLLRVQPGIFEYMPQGSTARYAAAVKLDGSVAGPTNPVSRGHALSIFLTGIGPVLPILQTGQVGPTNPPAVTYLQPVVGVAGVGAQVLFSGYAPGFLGLYQINIVIPDAAPAGSVNLDVVVDRVPSQTSKIAVQ